MNHRKGFRTPPEGQAKDPLVSVFQSAVSFHRQGSLTEAKKLYEEVLKKNPNHFDTLHLSGVLALQSGRPDEAEALFAKAIRINANFAALHFNRGIALQEMKRFDEALESHDKAIEIKPDFAEVFFNRGNTLQELNRLAEALASYDAAISIKADHAEALFHRGIVLEELKRWDEAIESYDSAISNKADYAEAFYHRGMALEELKRFDEASQSYDKAISIKSNYADAYWNKAVLRLLLGEFGEGFTLFEWRKLKKTQSGGRSYSKPLWLGSDRISGKTILFDHEQGIWLSSESIIGKTILVHYEQGLGDTIHFCRYISILANTGAKILFAPHKPLKRLIASLRVAFEVVDAEDHTLQFDYHCPLLSLPLAFKTDLATIPNEIPYLNANPELISKWKQRIGEAGFKIGICWQGSTGKADAGRSFPLTQFQVLSGIAGVRLISLHKGDGEAQLSELPEGMTVETLGKEYDAGPDAFLDTAAVMKCCDLVITSDTAVAHLAGALGVKTWVALKYIPEWRWMLDREDSPWYPTMRLFRQNTDGDWAGVFSVIKDALSTEIPRNGEIISEENIVFEAPDVPISWGELIDKITILEIKSARITSQQSVENVRFELEILNEKAREVLARRPAVLALKQQLVSVNETLWNIEEQIREKETKLDFDTEFIELARLVYKTNDHRTLLKREINILLNSKLIEEKSYLK